MSVVASLSFATACCFAPIHLTLIYVFSHILAILTSVPSSSSTRIDSTVCFTANPYPIPSIRATSIQNIYVLQTLSQSQ